jgi:hypothetical protein
LISSKATTGTPTGTIFNTHGYENTTFSLCIVRSGNALQSRPVCYVLDRICRVYNHWFFNRKQTGQ